MFSTSILLGSKFRLEWSVKYEERQMLESPFHSHLADLVLTPLAQARSSHIMNLVVAKILDSS